MNNARTTSYGDFAEVYDRLTLNVDYDNMARRIVSILIENGIDKGLLLDLACGTGTLISKILSSYNEYELIGADLSNEMLSKAYEKLNKGGHKALLLCQKIEELDLYGTVAAAFCTLDSINHLIMPWQLTKTFEKLRLFIEPGGLFLFDVNTEFKHSEILAQSTFVYELDDVFCVWQNSTDTNNLITEISLDVFTKQKGGLFKHFSESFSERAYSDEFLSKALEECGFTIIGKYDGYSDKSPDKRTQRVLYVSRR